MSEKNIHIFFKVILETFQSGDEQREEPDSVKPGNEFETSDEPYILRL